MLTDNERFGWAWIFRQHFLYHWLFWKRFQANSSYFAQLRVIRWGLGTVLLRREGTWLNRIVLLALKSVVLSGGLYRIAGCHTDSSWGCSFFMDNGMWARNSVTPGQIPCFLLSETVLASCVCPFRSPSAQAAAVLMGCKALTKAPLPSESVIPEDWMGLEGQDAVWAFSLPLRFVQYFKKLSRLCQGFICATENWRNWVVFGGLLRCFCCSIQENKVIWLQLPFSLGKRVFLAVMVWREL